MKKHLFLTLALASASALLFSNAPAKADGDRERDGDHGDYRGVDRGGLPSHAQLQAALKRVVARGTNGGFGLNMWATMVNRDGVVVAVAFSGQDRGDQWPGSRVISAQKANTANAF